MNPLIAIPARLASTRLPGKPLADIHGSPMIVHVWRRAIAAGLGPVIVAVAEPEIAAAVAEAGGTAILTAPELPSGSDRIHAAAEHFDPEHRYDVIINVQGDLPAIDPAVIRAVLDPLRNPAVDIATLVTEITDPAEMTDPNVVKAVIEPGPDHTLGRALYFTRMAAPSGPGPRYHHIGLYAFRRASLGRFVALPPSVLEQRERLEQLRALAHGLRIDAAVVDAVPFGVDTPADLERARALLAPTLQMSQKNL